jgi:hypothetical protein
MRKIETLMLKAISEHRNWSSGNTSVQYESGNDICRVFLHGNLISEIGRGFITLHDGGWQTVTTKSRLNSILREYGEGAGIYQKNYTWFLHDKKTQKEEEFASGVTLY